jgi:hypothetical protein
MGPPIFEPNSEEEQRWLASEVAASVETVGQTQRMRNIMGLERRDPERAARIVTELARGTSRQRIRTNLKVGGKVLTRLVADHHELLARTRAWRVQTSSRLASKTAAALEAKLDGLLEDPELLHKTSVKDLAVCYAIASDKERAARGEMPVVRHEHKVSIDDARLAIEAACNRIAEGRRT